MLKEVFFGETAVALKASAATPIRYKSIFHSDLLTDLNSIGENAENIDVISQLAYTMALQGVGSDFTAASQDTFYSWLDQFEAMDILTAAPEIMNVYNTNAKVTSIAKKKNAEPSAN